MSKNVTYDFAMDFIIGVDAPIGTDPDTLWNEVLNKLHQRVMERDVTFTFENVFDKETGAYEEDWENYKPG